MKHLLVLAVISSLNAFASTPTMYVCKSADTNVTYTTTSFIGKPSFHAEFQGEKVVHDGKIKTQSTSIGTLVSVQDSHLTLVDGPTMNYTLVIPFIKLDEKNTPAQFNTQLVGTSVGNPFFHAPSSEVVQSNTFQEVHCEASYVVF